TPTPTPTWTPTPTPAPSALFKEAESNSSKRGNLISITSSTVGASNGAYVGWTATGDVLVFNNVNLNGIHSLQTRVATPLTGSTIEVRIGGRRGKLIGIVKVPNTGGWAGTANWKTVTTSLTSVSGTQNLYLVFKNGTAGVADIDWLNLQY
ncbi:MAG: carbohydrate-binding protein, partial [Pseudobdellovibrionaceae bacterium]